MPEPEDAAGVDVGALVDEEEPEEDDMHIHMRGPGLAKHEDPDGQVAPVQGPLLQVTLSVGTPGGSQLLVPAAHIRSGVVGWNKLAMREWETASAAVVEIRIGQPKTAVLS